MASVYVDKVFDAMNSSKCLVQWRVTALLKEQTLNTRINTKYTRIKYKILNTRIYQFSYRTIVNNKYFPIHGFAQNISIPYLPVNSLIHISKLLFF